MAQRLTRVATHVAHRLWRATAQLLRRGFVFGGLLAVASTLGAPVQAAAPVAASRALGLDIRVLPGGWGDVAVERIERVLYAVADELVTTLPPKLAAPIVVSHTRGNPVALYQRGAAGEYQVRLHASGTAWPLYVYEFAHELCHVMSNHDEHAEVKRHNQWFEETLCETASLYALQAVARTWTLTATDATQVALAPRLRRFYDNLLAERTRDLPAGATLPRWVDDNVDRLRADPYLREKNDLVAKQLLPFFQHDPRRWRALAHLNLHVGDAHAAFADYLAHWNDYAPAEYHPFIADVRLLLTPVVEATTLVAEAATASVPPPSTASAAVSGHASAGPLRAQSNPNLKAAAVVEAPATAFPPLPWRGAHGLRGDQRAQYCPRPKNAALPCSE